MPDVLDVAFDVLIAVTVVVTAGTIGMETGPEYVRVALRRRRALASAGIVNAVALPLVAFMIVNALPMSDGAATGVLLCAICAAGPLGLKAAQIARGDLGWTVSLILILTVLNAVTLPLWTAVLLPESVAARPSELLGAMVVFVVLPLVLGALFGRRRPQAAAGLVPRLEVLSNITLVLAISIAIVGYSDDLWAAAASWAPAATVLVLAVAPGAGLLDRGQPDAVRRVTTLVTMNRATGIALLVGSRAFADQAGVFSAVITYGLMQTAAVVAVALVWRLQQRTRIG